jgi:hypothetical protein
MWSRCIECSKCNKFRNQRGNRLANQRCECGGKLEIVGGSHTLSGKHPFDSNATHTSDWWEGEYFYAEANRKKEYFVFHEGYLHKIENPIFPTRKLITEQNPERGVATDAQ